MDLSTLAKEPEAIQYGGYPSSKLARERRYRLQIGIVWAILRS